MKKNYSGPFPVHTRKAALPLSAIAVAASLLLGGAAFIAPQAVQAAAPQVKTQAPGWYRMMLGDFEVTAISDGTLPLPVDKLLNNPAAKTKQALARSYQQAPVETS